MHASIDQLLKLRDGARAGDSVAAHVRECTECRTTLDSVTNVTAALRTLPSRFTAPERWSAVAAKLAGAPAPEIAPRSRPGWFLPAASAALVLVVVLLTFGDRDTPAPAEDATATSVVTPERSRQRLLVESQRLESVLASLPAEPRLTRAHTALTLADLEDRIQWVDYRLNLASEAGLGNDEAEQLWRERVDLLNSLVAVRYAQTRAMAF